MTSSFDITEVYMEIVVGEEDEDTYVTAFKYYRTMNDLNFGMVGRWLIDLEDEIEFPKENGRYSMRANWNDNSEIIEDIFDIKRL